MRVKIETTARLKKNIKGTRREGQRIVKKGTEPCILWAINETGPTYRETEAHISLNPDYLRISVPESSKLNSLITKNKEYHFHFVASFVTGRMAPLCMSVEPISNNCITKLGIEYICRQPFEQNNEVGEHVEAYRLGKTLCS